MAVICGARERDRLLRQSACSIGLLIDAAALAMVLFSGALLPTALPFAVALLLGLVTAHVELARRAGLGPVIMLGVGGILLGFAFTVALAPGNGFAGFALISAANAITATLALAVTTSVRRLVLLLPVLVVSACPSVLIAGTTAPTVTAVQSLLPWGTLSWFALWISTAVPQVIHRIDSIGTAHRVERQASETEAQRRQGARLLHDTVLATLTLLAHSGRGVSVDALRQQATEDAQLLRQLRLGETPALSTSGMHQLTSVTTTPATSILESMQNRFGRMGLDVIWHGSRKVLLTGAALDSFLMALAECLENVRRHSGVNSADVTLTEDSTTVRAMITDAGVGFDIETVPSTKLGFNESVVARLADVGGNTRLFSSPGSGTTVVLEVPK
ncbi:sensor histidine kinase [Rathayibacter toxicus]|uniref:sensor histidine kinase n=1 Tax=Rathayibacter toxicus TaxID=145458 RepID=UPI000CE78F54|nr:ATP-binding protein [Rathayibacter toxicus]PPI54312.1 histidine kinase [Rathayibacter toxicus]QOD10982.1 histidine kinase [Rathayibacter toxicus]QWL27726.1 histidine kinase [Rathayibacter toxicus]